MTLSMTLIKFFSVNDGIVLKLLRSGADINKQNNFGNSLVHISAYKGKTFHEKSPFDQNSCSCNQI